MGLNFILVSAEKKVLKLSLTKSGWSWRPCLLVHYQKTIVLVLQLHTHTWMYKKTRTKQQIWTHKHKQTQVSLTYIHRMYTRPYFYHQARVHKDIRAKQLCLLSNWEENNSSSSKRFSIFFSFARCSARRGLVPLWVMSQCVQPHCIKKHELATLFTDTHFVAWHCQTIFPLHLPSTATHPRLYASL